MERIRITDQRLTGSEDEVDTAIQGKPVNKTLYTDSDSIDEYAKLWASDD